MLNFSSSKVLIAGDIMLDRYWIGNVERISPEAPVPVVHIRDIKNSPGGAGNVAANIASLGSKAILLSVVGNDSEALILHELLRSYGVDTSFLVNSSAPTTVKLRVISRGQQIVRVDFEDIPNHELILPLVDQFHNRLEGVNAVLFSDYGKGGLIHIKQMMLSAIRCCKPVLIDPKGSDYSIYHGATIITPNLAEFALAAGHWTTEAEFERLAFSMRDNLQLGALLVTRSEEGMSLFLGSKHIRVPAQAREVFDVSGAGDTVIAVMATAIACGYDIESAARLANIAAGIVVGKSGTTPITLEELNTYA